MKLTEDEWRLIETSLRGTLARIRNDQELEQLIEKIAKRNVTSNKKNRIFLLKSNN